MIWAAAWAITPNRPATRKTKEACYAVAWLVTRLRERRIVRSVAA